tara:strand:- start:201 stop:515 length:315 start_codon:yes stop_codon:yes gene_type:complete
MKFDHIAVKSTNISKSVDWYCKNLKCCVEYVDESWAMLNCEGTKIALVQEGSHPPHIAFQVESSLKFPCKQSEVRVHRDKSSYYYGSDPDGNIIEWVAYTDEEE